VRADGRPANLPHDEFSQEHSGAVDGSTLYVQYNYAGADDGLRLESVC